MQVDLQQGTVLERPLQHLEGVQHLILRLEDGTPILIAYQHADSVYTVKHTDAEFADVLAMVATRRRIVAPSVGSGT